MTKAKLRLLRDDDYELELELRRGKERYVCMMSFLAAQEPKG